MPLISVGLSYRTAPIDLRERFALDDDTMRAALQDVHALPAIKEVAILSTCNRLEIYASASNVKEGWQALEDYLRQRNQDDSFLATNHLYYSAEQSAVEHLMRVACGLDSLILGEPQILGQVGTALTQAAQAGTTGALISHLFNDALRAGKRARSETPISRHTTSTSHAAVLLATEHAPNLAMANALVVGAGDMASLAVKALHARGVQNIGCVNRTHARAAALVRAIGGQAFNWYHLSAALTWADVVITATGAPHTVIHKEELDEIVPQRQGRPLVLVDIALPRDVEEEVCQIPSVHLFDIDDLQETLDANLAQREAARPHVRAIIAEEVESFLHWYRSRSAVPTLVDMRRKVRTIAESELTDALSQLRDLDDREQEVVKRMVHRLVNKVLHEPTVQLKAAAARSPELGTEYVEAVQTLFGLADGSSATGSAHAGVDADAESAVLAVDASNRALERSLHGYLHSHENGA